MTSFDLAFGRVPEARGQAPGRVNLIGEHIDYNGGSVLPMPLPQHATVEIGTRGDRAVRVASASFGGAQAKDAYVLGAEVLRGTWVDYVQGTTRLLARGGYSIEGFDAFVESDVPIGSGLSSSAAMLVALLRALRSCFHLVLDDLEIASIAQRVENEFVGARVGVMDPMVASLGRPGEALLIETQALTYRYVPLPEDLEIVVIDSGVAHRHAGGEYNRRRDECEIARSELHVRHLCDLGAEDLDRIALLPDPLRRRARHAVTENLRVHQAVAALEQGRLAELGALLDASHASLREDFEVSTDEVDFLVDALRREVGIHGARMTGGGFGGSVLAIAMAGSGREAARRASERYERATGRRASIVAPPGVYIPSFGL